MTPDNATALVHQHASTTEALLLHAAGRHRSRRAGCHAAPRSRTPPAATGPIATEDTAKDQEDRAASRNHPISLHHKLQPTAQDDATKVETTLLCRRRPIPGIWGFHLGKVEEGSGEDVPQHRFKGGIRSGGDRGTSRGPGPPNITDLIPIEDEQCTI